MTRRQQHKQHGHGNWSKLGTTRSLESHVIHMIEIPLGRGRRGTQTTKATRRKKSAGIKYIFWQPERESPESDQTTEKERRVE